MNQTNQTFIVHRPPRTRNRVALPRVFEVTNRLTEVVPSFGMRFAPQKCKVLPQDIELPESALVSQNEELENVDHFTYLGSCINPDASVNREIGARISKARLIYRSLNRLRRHRGISLYLKGQAYKTTQFFYTDLKHGQHFAPNMSDVSRYLISDVCAASRESVKGKSPRMGLCVSGSSELG